MKHKARPIGAIAMALSAALAPSTVQAQTTACEGTQPGFTATSENAWRPIDFVPQGWVLYDKIDGDLTGNGRADSVLIVKRNDPARIVDNRGELGYDYYDCNRRAVLVVLQSDIGEYRLAASDDAIIPDWSAPTIDDPYESVAIDNGSVVLRLNFFANAGSWSSENRSFRFRWDQKRGQMPLIGYERNHVHRGSGDMERTSVNYLSGKRKDLKGSISDTEENWRWGTLPKNAPPVLGAIGDGFEFKP